MRPLTNRRARRRSAPARRAQPTFAPNGEGRRARRRPPALGIFLVLALGVLVVTAFQGLARCSDASIKGGDGPYVSPYDWTKLQRQGDRLSYWERGKPSSQLGVDVSDHQGPIDWAAVAQDGIDFALVRAGYRGYTRGSLSADARFSENLDGAAAAGLEVGAYFFSQALDEDEAREEADFVLEALKERKLTMPIAYDHEPIGDAAGRANEVDRQTLTACARAFCERIEAAGYATMIYGNAGDMARYDLSGLGKRPIWFAEYDAAQPDAQFDFSLWQYTNAGSVAGIETSVDLNLLLPPL